MVDPHGSPAPTGSGGKTMRTVQRTLAIVVGIALVVGGHQAWLIGCATRDFEIVVVPSQNVTGRRSMDRLNLESLVERFDYTLEYDGEELVRFAAEDTVASFNVEGRLKYEPISQGLVEGYLIYPGADERLRLQIGRPSAEAPGRLRHELTERTAQRLMTKRIGVEMGIVQTAADGGPGPDVTDLGEADIGSLTPVRERGDGVYRFEIGLEDLLHELGNSQDDSLRVLVDRGDDSVALAIPLSWFVRVADRQVLQLNERVERFILPPRLEQIEPTHVVQGSGWSGDIRVRGDNLRRVARAELRRGSQSIPLRVAESESRRLLVEVDPSKLTVGRYDFVIMGGSADEPLVLPRAFELATSLRLLEPGNGVKLSPGDALRIRWEAAGVTERMRIEAWLASDGGNAPPSARVSVFDGSAATSIATWNPSGMEPGEYILQARVPDRPDLPVLTRTFEILPPEAVTVTLQILHEGELAGRIRRVVVDGREIDLGIDPALVRMELLPGTHTVRVIAVDGSEVTRIVDVNEGSSVYQIELAE